MPSKEFGWRNLSNSSFGLLFGNRYSLHIHYYNIWYGQIAELGSRDDIWCDVWIITRHIASYLSQSTCVQTSTFKLLEYVHRIRFVLLEMGLLNLGSFSEMYNWARSVLWKFTLERVSWLNIDSPPRQIDLWNLKQVGLTTGVVFYVPVIKWVSELSEWVS